MANSLQHGNTHLQTDICFMKPYSFVLIAELSSHSIIMYKVNASPFLQFVPSFLKCDLTARISQPSKRRHRPKTSLFQTRNLHSYKWQRFFGVNFNLKLPWQQRFAPGVTRGRKPPSWKALMMRKGNILLFCILGWNLYRTEEVRVLWVFIRMAYNGWTPLNWYL